MVSDRQSPLGEILFDQGTPVPLRRHLPEHSVDTASELGWSTLRNGALLDRAEQNGYDLLITTDQSIPYQQSLIGRRIGVLILRPNSWPRIRLRIDTIQASIGEVEPGTAKHVTV